jgi:hypothetical protein
MSFAVVGEDGVNAFGWRVDDARSFGMVRFHFVFPFPVDRCSRRGAVLLRLRYLDAGEG